MLLWAAVFAASTQLHTLDLPVGHGICGPWGCAAEPEALLGYHLLWLTLLGPTLVLVCRTLGAPHGSHLANAAWKVGFLVAAGVVLWGAVAWLRAGEPPRYALQRGLFLLASTPDLPVIPLAVSGLAARFTTSRAAGKNPSNQVAAPS